MKLTTESLEAIINKTEVINAAMILFDGDSHAAAKWLLSPRDLLGGQAPWETANSAEGKAIVFSFIRRIENGVFT